MGNSDRFAKYIEIEVNKTWYFVLNGGKIAADCEDFCGKHLINYFTSKGVSRLANKLVFLKSETLWEAIHNNRIKTLQSIRQIWDRLQVWKLFVDRVIAAWTWILSSKTTTEEVRTHRGENWNRTSTSHCWAMKDAERSQGEEKKARILPHHKRKMKGVFLAILSQANKSTVKNWQLDWENVVALQRTQGPKPD